MCVNVRVCVWCVCVVCQIQLDEEELETLVVAVDFEVCARFKIWQERKKERENKRERKKGGLQNGLPFTCLGLSLCFGFGARKRDTPSPLVADLYFTQYVQPSATALMCRFNVLLQRFASRKPCSILGSIVLA